MSAHNPYRYRVYVIELDTAAHDYKTFHKHNPDVSPTAPCFYVGQTALSPKARFENHQKGHKSCRLVKRYGKRLRPDLYQQYKSFKKREYAEHYERILIEELRNQGFAAYSN